LNACTHAFVLSRAVVLVVSGLCTWRLYLKIEVEKQRRNQGITDEENGEMGFYNFNYKGGINK
jgi:hypothetical protein